MRRINEIEGLRVFLAWWVVLDHFILLTDIYSVKPTGLFHFPLAILLSFAGNAAYSVEIFMIISGFVIFYLMDHKKTSYVDFIVGRFFRLFPLYLACVAGAIVISPMSLSNINHLISPHNDFAMRSDRIHEWHTHFAACLIPTVLMLQGLVPDKVIPSIENIFLAPTWSLTLEWQFYLVAPLLYLAFKTQGRRALITVAVILLCMAIGPTFGWNRSLLFANTRWFFVGMTSYCLFQFLEKREKPLLAVNEEAFALLFLMIIAAIRNVTFCIWALTFITTLSDSLFTRTPWFLTRILTGVRYVLCYPVTQVLGKVSYSTYLVHWLVIDGVIWCFLRANPSISPCGLFFEAAIPTIILVALCSMATYELIEKPGMALGKFLLRRSAGSTSGVLEDRKVSAHRAV